MGTGYFSGQWDVQKSLLGVSGKHFLVLKKDSRRGIALLSFSGCCLGVTPESAAAMLDLEGTTLEPTNLLRMAEWKCRKNVGAWCYLSLSCWKYQPWNNSLYLWVPIFRENKYPPNLSLFSLDCLLLAVKCILTNIGDPYRTGKKVILGLFLLRFLLPFL